MNKTRNIKDLTDRIRRRTNTIKYFSPTNFDEEKKKFFAKNSYNPQFEYPELPEEYLRNALAAIDSTSTQNNTLVETNRLLETKYKIELLLSRGDPDKITTSSEKLYQCTFQQKYVEEAKKAAKDNIAFRQNKVKPEEIRKNFQTHLKKYGIADWRIVITRQKDFNIQVRYKREKIRISEDINLDFSSLDSLIAHEIDGHIVRAINALTHKDPEFQNPLPFYIKTEEGLASYLGDHHAENGELSKKHHAIKYLGCYIALNNSFREVYNFFIDNGFTPDLAFLRAVRIKKGFTDTSLPGCNVREAIYWEGMLEVKKYLDEGGDLRKLYSGKVGLDDVDYLPESENVILPERLII